MISIRRALPADLDFLLELVNHAYMANHDWQILRELLTQKLYVSMFVIQFFVGSAIPFALLGALVVYRHAIGDRARHGIAFAASLLLLVQVLAMRWNVVIGGQMFSKSFRGFLTFDVDLAGREGLVAAVLLFSLPFLVMLIFSRVLPFWGPVSSAPGRWLEPEPAEHVSLRDHSSFTDVGL